MARMLNTHIHVRSNQNYDALAAELAKRVNRDTSETIRQAIAFAHDNAVMFELWLALNRVREGSNEQAR